MKVLTSVPLAMRNMVIVDRAPVLRVTWFYQIYGILITTTRTICKLKICAICSYDTKSARQESGRVFIDGSRKIVPPMRQQGMQRRDRY